MKEFEKELATLKEKSNALEKAMTPEFNKKLFYYCIYRFKKKFNIKFDTDRGFRGILIEDIIEETIISFLKDGGRNWNKKRFPKFEEQFISSLDSVISNTIKKELPNVNQTLEIIENKDTTLEKDNKEYQDLLDLCYNILEKLNASDEEILLFEPYIIGGMKREDLAKTFNISVNELTNIKKRLDRKLPTIREEIEKTSL